MQQRTYTIEELQSLVRVWDLENPEVHGPGSPTLTELHFLDWLNLREQKEYKKETNFKPTQHEL